MMGTRQNLKTGYEVDVVCAKHHYLYTKHISHQCKKQMARRRRKEAKEELKLPKGE